MKTLVGLRVGRLTVTAQGPSAPYGGTRWICLCDCGQRVVRLRRSLLVGLKHPKRGTRSCGCSKYEAKLVRCHPGRKYEALGLCYECYHSQYSAKNKLRQLTTRSGITDLDGAAWALKLNECAICGATERLEIDHSHVTGQVRGRLCGDCNRGLGLFREQPERLHNAAAYLEAAYAAC